MDVGVEGVEGVANHPRANQIFTDEKCNPPEDE
jgi:hypothetical protein